MHFAGSVIWFVLGGGWTALLWLVGAAIFSLTAVGRPLTRAAVEMAGLSISPQGRDAVHIRDLGGQDPVPTTALARILGLAACTLWMLTFGLVLSAAYLALGVLCCLTVRGLPLGRKCFKLAALSLWPVGRRVVATDLATVPRQQAAVERFARHRYYKGNQAKVRTPSQPPANNRLAP
ncbi:MAG: putative rane protein [Proteobacteria bacterium]|nr:putative rane protein [Pseudomonadota bacterium]